MLREQSDSGPIGAQQKAQHFRPDETDSDPELARLIDCWPRLTDADRQALAVHAEQLAAGRIEVAR
jgi:hypothetical protein